MTDENQSPPHRRLELSSTQVAGSALAAVSAAFFASWLGTAGTLIGAGIGSIVATVGAAMYTWWLRRTSEAVRRTAAQVRETGMGSTVVVPRLRNRRPEGPRAAGEADDAGEDQDDAEPGGWAFLEGRPWGKVALVAAGVMLAALASITVVEAVTGKPISALLRGDTATGTSVGHVLGSDTSTPTKHQQRKQQTPSSPTPSPSAPTGAATPTPSPTPSTAPTPSPTPGATSSPTLSVPATPSPSASTPAIP